MKVVKSCAAGMRWGAHGGGGGGGYVHGVGIPESKALIMIQSCSIMSRSELEWSDSVTVFRKL